MSGVIGKDLQIESGVVGIGIAGTGAFCAGYGANGWISVGDTDILYFNNDSTGDRFDTDNNYNTTTGKYTIPATGVYYFYYAIYTANSATSNGFGFETNNGELADQNDAGYFGTYAQGTDDHIQFCATIQPLTSADTFWVSARRTSDVYRGHSRWGGCRIK
tara:strand:- start:307 stop:789 length:483 start_codon:yes stop_codon:yes gene_type:complete